MNQAMSESILQHVVPSECVDLYYPGETNSKRSCFPSYQENRYYLDLPALQFGSSSTLLFNPDGGLSDVVMTMKLPAVGGAGTAGALTYQGLGLASAWGYNMIESVGLRIGSSSYYTFTGDQLYAAVLADAEDSDKREKIAQLGGQALTTVADYASEFKRTAIIYLKCPWNSVSAQEKPLPLPTDLISQPVQWSIKLRPASEVFFQNPAGLILPATVISLPQALASAAANFKQCHMFDQSNLLARRENMNEKALAYPLRYFQNTTFKTQVNGITANQEVQLNLTGFRQGSLKDMWMWVVAASDYNSGNPFKWVPVKQCVIKVNGLVYYDSRDYSAQLWSMCERKTSASVGSTTLTAAGALITPSAAVTQYQVIPFAQHTENLADGEAENVMALGLNVQNSVINANIILGEDSAGVPLTGNYIFNFSYNYLSSVMFSRGGAEYIF